MNSDTSHGRTFIMPFLMNLNQNGRTGHTFTTGQIASEGGGEGERMNNQSNERSERLTHAPTARPYLYGTLFSLL